MKFNFLIYTVSLIGMLMTQVLISKNETIKIVHIFQIAIKTIVMATIANSGKVMSHLVCIITVQRVFSTTTQTKTSLITISTTCEKSFGVDFKNHFIKERKFSNFVYCL